MVANEKPGSKAALRRQFMAVRASLAQDQKRRLETQIIENLLQVLPPSAGYCAIYRAKGAEANISRIISERPDVRWIYPRVDGDDLHFYAAREEGTPPFLVGPMGIEEPDIHLSERVSIQDCQWAIIPGLVYDRNGFRLGYGRGYYDRALAEFNGVKIGIGFGLQLSNEDLPVEKHDLPMDFVVTEGFILQPLKELN